MVDFGATALADLRRRGRSPDELAGVAITHLHGDHIGGLPYFWIDALFNQRRAAPFRIIGPTGTRARLEELLRVTYGPIAEYERPFSLELEEIRPGQQASLAGLTVRAYAADHMDPPEEPLCLRLEAPNGGPTVAFSGDTSMCPGLFEAARGADLLIAECTTLAPPSGRHCTWSEWETELSKVEADRVLLTHLGADVRAAAQRGELTVDGVDLAFAEDGLIIPL